MLLRNVNTQHRIGDSVETGSAAPGIVSLQNIMNWWDEIANYCMSFLSEHASLQIESIWPLQSVYTIDYSSDHLLLSSAGFCGSILRSQLVIYHQAQSRTNISMSAASILEIACYARAVASRANPRTSIKVGTIACAALKNLPGKKSRLVRNFSALATS